jgi:mannosyl-oligosaccharide alpha-1,2-mannosidase
MFTAITRTWGALNDTSHEYDLLRRTPQAASPLTPSWMGATLKYFYLIFGDPAVASLDDFVFNAEAHPLRRLVR